MPAYHLYKIKLNKWKYPRYFDCLAAEYLNNSTKSMRKCSAVLCPVDPILFFGKHQIYSSQRPEAQDKKIKIRGEPTEIRVRLEASPQLQAKWKLMGQAMDWAKKKNVHEMHKPTDNWKSELTITATLTGHNGSYSVWVLTVNEQAEIEWNQHTETLTMLGIHNKVEAEAEIRNTKRSWLAEANDLGPAHSELSGKGGFPHGDDVQCA